MRKGVINTLYLMRCRRHADGIHEKFVRSSGRKIWLMQAVLKISHDC
jgi:hypothetical protein